MNFPSEDKRMKANFKEVQRGFSLIELLVSMAIGLVIVLVLTQFYISASGTQNTQNDAAVVNENVRFAFDLLNREIKKIGFTNTWQKGVVQGGNFCATSGAPPFLALNDPNTIDPASAALTGNVEAIYSPYNQGGTHTSNDVLRVSYYGEDNAGTTAIYDCQGNPVATGLAVQDTLFIKADPNNNNEPTLYCYSSNTPSQKSMPMVPGIESLQLLYGEDTDGDGVINRFVPANLLTNGDNVATIKISIVARGNSLGSTTGTGLQTAPIKHFSPSYPAAANGDPSAIFPAAGINVPSDNRFRKLFNSEVAFRNFRWCG